MAEPLGNSIQREAVTHVELNLIEFEVGAGRLNGVRATVTFGRETGDGFSRDKSVELYFDSNQANSSLTVAEKQALSSIRDKILVAAIARMT